MASHEPAYFLTHQNFTQPCILLSTHYLPYFSFCTFVRCCLQIKFDPFCLHWSCSPSSGRRATQMQAKCIKHDLCCFRRSNCTDCLSGSKDGCAWCTTLNKCVSLSEYSLDYSYGECLHFQAYPTHYQSQSTTTTQYVLYFTTIIVD